ncbi:Phytosulfokine [Hibiscus syriacus]|uniref:Phytosulfokine n=1 Tax=Hibiscus syriacus TaxID=106335 RepID=A0A6A2ZV47_HIBSY|nr:Phytosulfokine [Hibiscus syriacus]
MSKLCTLFVAALVFNFMLCYASRPHPTLPLIQHQADKVDVDDNCEEEGCLIKRTLAAHVDYIYTQSHNP